MYNFLTDSPRPPSRPGLPGWLVGIGFAGLMTTFVGLFGGHPWVMFAGLCVSCAGQLIVAVRHRRMARRMPPDQTGP